MEYKMRQAKREVREMSEIVKILDQCPILRIAFFDTPFPYIVPVNYGYSVTDENLLLFVHTAKAGRKIDLARQNERVGFETDRLIEVGKNEKPCCWTSYFESVIGHGTISFAEGEEKKAGMDAIMRRYGFTGPLNYDASPFDHVEILKIDVLSVVGKRHRPE